MNRCPNCHRVTAVAVCTCIAVEVSVFATAPRYLCWSPPSVARVCAVSDVILSDMEESDHAPTPSTLRGLTAVATTTSTSMTNGPLYIDLTRR